ncbi:MAG: rRNA maturation RNase YbeY [Syntrophorhabdaceae bacterium]|nr:rRNA maturation RNase YbeY [Syntrophorhabdaceae bacterium]MDD5244534.1 rRNA maturation RNase YbeY [Syntrophorhabdaceae bacterium]
MAVLIKNSQRSITINSRSVKRLTKKLLTFSGLQGKDISILFVNNRKITALNSRFFGKQYPTNVISFSYIDGLPGEIAGEIIISIEKAREEAEQSGVHFYERLFALIIHGLLHITGHDHEGEKNQGRRMRYREKKLLDFIVSHDVYKRMISERAA